MNRIFALLFVSLLLPSVSQAEIIVLTHGYLGSSNSWIKPGILQQLNQAGYPHNGSYTFSQRKISFAGTNPSPQAEQKAVYTVNLPSIIPVHNQADWLAAYLADLSIRHPKTAVTVIGHSAGGVAARLMLVRNGKGNVSKLITIASPHLGTPRADQAISATNNGGMLGWARGWAVRRYTGGHMYNTLQASRGLLNDLTPPRPGNMLFWLNQQPHPELDYISIVRSSDQVVPPVSQDMNRVPALSGKAETHIVAPGHFLRPKDAQLLLELL